MKVYVIVKHVDYEGYYVEKVVDSVDKAVEFCDFHDPVGVGRYEYMEMVLE